MAVYGSMENWQEQINRNNVGHWRTTPGRGRRVTPLQRNSDFDDELEGVRPADTEEEAPPQMAQRAAPAAAQAGGKPGMPPNPAAAQATAPTATLAQPSADLRRIAALPPEQRTPQEHYALKQRRDLEERNASAGAKINNPMLPAMQVADAARKEVAMTVAFDDAKADALRKAGRPVPGGTSPTTPAMTAPARATIPTETPPPPGKPNAALPGFAARTMPDGTVRAVSGAGDNQTFRSFASQDQARAFYRPGAQQPGKMLANAIPPPAPAATGGTAVAAAAPPPAATAPVQPAAPQAAAPAGPVITPAPMSDEEAYRMSQPVAAAQPAVQPHGGPTYGLDWWAKQQGQPSTFRPGPMPPAGTPLLRPQSTAVSALSGGSSVPSAASARFTAPTTRLAMQNAQFKSNMPTQPAGPVITPAPMAPELTITPAPMTEEEKARMNQPVMAQSTMPIRKPAPIQGAALVGRSARGRGGYQSEY